MDFTIFVLNYDFLIWKELVLSVKLSVFITLDLMPRIQEGEEVCILTTGETGILRRYLDRFFVQVDVNGEYRKVHITALQPVWLMHMDRKHEKSQTKKKKITGRDGMPDGLSMYFQPERNAAGEIERYLLMLINRTDADLRIHYEFLLQGSVYYSYRKELADGADTDLHHFRTDQLNDLPAFRITCWPLKSSEQTAHEAVREVRLKAKQFFSPVYAFGNDGALLMPFWKSLPGKMEKPVFQTPADDFDWEEQDTPQVHEVLEKASMPDFIDLHAEKLDQAWELLDKQEILQMQLNHCRNFVERAIRHKLHKVYIIHGLGKGILRKEIERLLDEYPSVTSYFNQYNPRFGHGATEVILE